jgi:hypothetical protein
VSEPTCGACRHWHRQPADPMNLGGAPAGACRARPPQLVVLPAERGLQITAMYPIIDGRLAACALHEPPAPSLVVAG